MLLHDAMFGTTFIFPLLLLASNFATHIPSSSVVPNVNAG